MFFVLSKTIGLLYDPLLLCAVLFTVAGGLAVFRRGRALRRALMAFGVGWVLILSMLVVGDLLLGALEAPYRARTKPSKPPRVIVVLTGMLNPQVMKVGTYEFADSADRFIEMLRLARTYPEATLLISGGSGDLAGAYPREAVVLGALAAEIGLDPARLVLEKRARNTRENAVRTAEMLKRLAVPLSPDDPVLLVTSAFHMRRAIGCFKKVGVPVHPWPVDFKTSRWHMSRLLPRVDGLVNSRIALREYVGLLAYEMAGYI